MDESYHSEVSTHCMTESDKSSKRKQSYEDEDLTQQSFDYAKKVIKIADESAGSESITNVLTAPHVRNKTCTLCWKTFLIRIGLDLPFSDDDKWETKCGCWYHASCALIYSEEQGGKGCPKCKTEEPLADWIHEKVNEAVKVKKGLN